MKNSKELWVDVITCNVCHHSESSSPFDMMANPTFNARRALDPKGNPTSGYCFTCKMTTNHIQTFTPVGALRVSS